MNEAEEEQNFIDKLLQKFPLLTKTWFKTMYEEQDHRGLITNMIMNLISNSDHCVEIYRHDISLGYTGDNCFLDIAQLSVTDAIPSLFKAWTEAFHCFVKVIEGEDEDIDFVQPFRDVTSILKTQIHANIQSDMKDKNFKLPINMSIEQFIDIVYTNAVKKLQVQNGTCTYTRIALMYSTAWNQCSLKRVDNKLCHFTLDGTLPNCIFICRLFNSAPQLSTTAILEIMLQQKLVPVGDDTRKTITRILGI